MVIFGGELNTYRTNKGIDMPDNNGMLDDLEFENQINELGDDQPALIKFVARQQFSTSKVLIDHGRRIKSLEGKNKKMMGAVGGASAFVATVITATIDYFLKRG